MLLGMKFPDFLLLAGLLKTIEVKIYKAENMRPDLLIAFAYIVLTKSVKSKKAAEATFKTP